MSDALHFVFELLDRLGNPASRATKALDALDRGAKRAKGGVETLEKALPEKQVARATGRLGSLQAAVGEAFGKKSEGMLTRFVRGTLTAEDASKIVSKGWAAAGQATQTAGGAMATAAGLAGTAVAGLTSVLLVAAGAAAHLASAGASMAADMALFRERTEFSLRFALGSSQAAQRTYGYIQGISSSLGMSSKEAAGNLRAVLKKGFSQGEGEQIVQMLADLKAVGGEAVSPEAIAGPLQALKRQGALSADMFQPLIDAGIDQRKIYDSLAKQLNIKAADQNAQKRLVDAALAQGQVRGQKALDVYRNTFLAGTGKSEAGGVAKELADTTVAGSVDKVKAKLEALFGAINSSGAGKALVSVLQQISSAIDPGSESGKKLLAVLDRAAGVAERLFGKLDVGTLVDGLGAVADVIDSVLPYFEALGGGVLQGVKEALSTVVEVLDLFRAKSDPGPSRALVDALRAIGTAAGYFIVGVVAGVSAIAWLYATIASIAVQLPGKAADIGRALVTGIGDGIESAKAWLLEKLTALADALPGPIKQALQIRSPSRVFAGLGRFTAQGFAQGVEQGTPDVEARVASMVEVPRAALPAGGGKSGTNNISVTINVEGAGKAASDIAESVRAELVTFFEQLALEQGLLGAGGG